jgi:hypothetical protein
MKIEFENNMVLGVTGKFVKMITRFPFEGADTMEKPFPEFQITILRNSIERRFKWYGFTPEWKEGDPNLKPADLYYAIHDIMYATFTALQPFKDFSADYNFAENERLLAEWAYKTSKNDMKKLKEIGITPDEIQKIIQVVDENL